MIRGRSLEKWVGCLFPAKGGRARIFGWGGGEVHGGTSKRKKGGEGIEKSE